MKSTKQFLLLGVALIGMTACAKKFSQSDLDNARREGVSSAQPSSNRVALLTAQKNFAPKARIAAYIADTMQRSLLLEGAGNSGFYSKPEALKEVKKWADTTKAAIKAAFGAPTNTAPNSASGFKSMTKDKANTTKSLSDY